MSDSLMEKTTLDVPADFEKGRHFDFIKSTIPECLVQASPLRRKVLKDTKPTVPLWYENSSTDQRSALKALMEIDCHAQNNWDKTLAAVDSVTTFAKPLLTTALAEADIDLDVEKTWVRLYYPVDYEFFGIATGVSTGDVRSRTFSLLQAALHNFETFEAEEGYFDKDSSFITGPDTQGRFDVIDSTLKIQQFVAICRELDIGGQYQKFINKFLYEGGAAHEQALSLAFIDSKKSAMKAAAYAALLKGDIELAHHELIVALINEQDVVKDKDSRRPISYSPLSLMGYEIAECAVFFPTHANRYDGSYVIAYIPDDPEHSIKKYASFADFEEQLTHQLMYRPPGSRIDSAKDALTDYQRFFSRFISEKDRGHFFLRFTEKVLDAPSGTYWKDQVRGYLKYVSPASRLVGPVADRHWRRDPVENIDLHAKLSLNFQWVGMAGIWTEMFRQKRRHLREDAQVLAVSTATEDAITRERRLANYLNIGLSIVGIAAFFVPPVGAAMLLITADQLLFETIEGARELSQGDKEAGWAHITDVLENLATMAALAPVFHYTVSPFIEGLKSVTLPSGKTRLWKPDLKPYERNVKLPANARLDESGLHRHAGEDILPLEGKHYA
ncbi:dermonecrotic toxin domain-containing protein, partial [Pseudomonas sp. P5_A2_2]